MARACASVSSRLSSPSRRPSTPAAAPLEVAMASKPSPASRRAEPASQALGMMKVPGRWCSARKRLALSLCVGFILDRLLSCCAMPARPPAPAPDRRSDRPGSRRRSRCGSATGVIENALAAPRRHARMRHRRRVRGQRLGAAEAHGELDHLEPVEQRERARLRRRDFEREGRAGAIGSAARAAAGRGGRPGRKSRYQTFSTFGCARRNSATRRAPAAPASIRSFSVSSERISSHAVCGSHIVPSVERIRRTGASISLSPTHAAGDQVANARRRTWSAT